ncbi:uracil phosphoribosyltransferase [Rheinheimera sp.]|uniref:uracil phosphoribosyltransferase n=1 Tax=Rheinheimera sp. TaxID=1869214 RepID=UPI0027BA2B42|nr:uracil phosphoribosyltransferase [Rheinheimera sp.]
MSAQILPVSPVYSDAALAVIELAQSDRLRALHAQMRDRRACQSTFTFYADQVIRLLLEQAYALLPFTDHQVTTPLGATYQGKRLATGLCAVSVMRAGESMEFELQRINRDIPIGKILVQRHQQSKQPHLYYSKLPNNIAQGYVMLFEPMLATGGSALCALDVLLAEGVPAERILLLNLLSSPSGLARVSQQQPKVQIITSSIEQGLTEQAYMLPGIGDFGDRYFGTWQAEAV